MWLAREWKFQLTAARRRLVGNIVRNSGYTRFNSQPPEGGWVDRFASTNLLISVSTHSRPKAAGES